MVLVHVITLYVRMCSRVMYLVALVCVCMYVCMYVYMCVYVAKKLAVRDLAA